MKAETSFRTIRTVLMASAAMALTSCINPWSFWFPPDVPYQLEGDRIVYYIAPGGNDKAQGDSSAPLGSLQGAFNRIRTTWRDDDLGKIFTFRVKPGTYLPGGGLVSSGKYGALLSSRIHSDGTAIMDIRVEFLGTPDNPVVLDGRGMVDSVFVFQTGTGDYALQGAAFSPAIPGQITDADTDTELVSLPGGYQAAFTGLDHLTVIP